MTTKMRRAEYKFPQAVPEEPQQDKRMPDQEQDSIVVAAKTVRISLSGQQQRKQQPVALKKTAETHRNRQRPAAGHRVGKTAAEQHPSLRSYHLAVWSRSE